MAISIIISIIIIIILFIIIIIIIIYLNAVKMIFYFCLRVKILFIPHFHSPIFISPPYVNEINIPYSQICLSRLKCIHIPLYF